MADLLGTVTYGSYQAPVDSLALHGGQLVIRARFTGPMAQLPADISVTGPDGIRCLWCSGVTVTNMETGEAVRELAAGAVLGLVVSASLGEGLPFALEPIASVARGAG